jgi:hypothetical protein
MSARRTHAVLVVDSATRIVAGWVLHRDVLWDLVAYYAGHIGRR